MDSDVSHVISVVVDGFVVCVGKCLLVVVVAHEAGLVSSLKMNYTWMQSLEVRVQARGIPAQRRDARTGACRRTGFSTESGLTIGAVSNQTPVNHIIQKLLFSTAYQIFI